MSETTQPAAPNDEPTILILYGGTGDLAKRMVLPAIYELFTSRPAADPLKLIGNGRGDVAHEDFKNHIRDVLTEFATAPEPDPWKGFAKNVRSPVAASSRTTPAACST